MSILPGFTNPNLNLEIVRRCEPGDITEVMIVRYCTLVHWGVFAADLTIVLTLNLTMSLLPGLGLVVFKFLS